MEIKDFLGPAATVFGYIFTGTAALWIGAKVGVKRFISERAFERRLHWYDLIRGHIQDIRSISFQIMTNHSRLGSRQYTELAAQAITACKAFDKAASDRVWASEKSAQAVMALGLTSLQLQGTIPGLNEGRKMSLFWEHQHRDWSVAYHALSDELASQFLLRKSSRGKAGRMLFGARSKLKSLLPSRKRGLKSKHEQSATRSIPDTKQDSQTTDLRSEEADQLASILDILLSMVQARKVVDAGSDHALLRFLNAAQIAMLRVADLRSTTLILSYLDPSRHRIEGFQQKHIARFLCLVLYENANQFEAAIAGLLKSGRSDITQSHASQLDALRREVVHFRKENGLRLQRFRNSLLSQHHPEANLHIEALLNVSVSETVRLAFIHLDWLTRFVNLLREIVTARGAQNK
jgi:hypothetical protein